MDEELSFKNARDAHHSFLSGSFISEVKQSGDSTFVFSSVISDQYWTYASNACLTGNVAGRFIDEGITYCLDHGRLPCLLIPSDTPIDVTAHINDRGLIKAHEDSWMLFGSSNLVTELPPKVKITNCQSTAELDIFLDVFFAAYSGTDPNEPYGALPPEYGKAVRRSFELKHEKGLQYFLLSVDDEPAGVAMLGCKNQIACLYGLGIRPAFRKQSLAGYLTQHRIGFAQAQNAKLIFLQTEANSYNERLFLKFGFEKWKIFTAFVLPPSQVSKSVPLAV